MEVVTGAMSTLLPKLGGLLKEEYKLQKDVREEITSLKTKLEKIEVALLEVSEAPIDQPPNRLVKLWTKNVKELSYDIEDSVDKFIVDTRVHTKPYGLRRFINRSLNLLTKANHHHKIGIDIKDIEVCIKEVSERRDRYMFDNVATKPVGPMIDRLLPKLGDLLKEEYELPKTTRGKIMFLEAELESMQAALLKVSEANLEAPIGQLPDIQLELWASDVKDLSYDIEDSVDKFMVRVDTRAPKKMHGLRGFIDRSLNLLAKAHLRHKIGTDIKDIKSCIKEVSERHDRYRVDNVPAKLVGPSIDSLCLSILYKKATKLVGTEERSEGLIKRLMEGDEASKQQLKVVSIVGFGGLGKTTLANLVYQKLKVQFDCGAFVSVSLNPDTKVIMKKMLHQLGESISEATLDEA